MTEFVELINTFGVGVVAIAAMMFIFLKLINWLTGKHDKAVDDNHKIIVALIDRVREMDEHLIEIGGKSGIKRRQR